MPVIQQYNHNALRNFSYLIYCDKTKDAIIIDPFDGEEVSKIIKDNDLQPRMIVNTHEHWDHIQGNSFLTEAYDLEVIYQDCFAQAYPGITKTVKSKEEITLGETIKLRFLSSPGHTESHLTILLTENNKNIAVFSGDTLFNAGVGNCKNGGDPKVLYQTINSIYDQLGDELIVYPGHDYLENNLKFTLSIEDNVDARQLLERQVNNEFNEKPLSMAVERKINLFLIDNRKLLKKNDKFSQDSDEQIFVKLRKIRDQW